MFTKARFFRKTTAVISSAALVLTMAFAVQNTALKTKALNSNLITNGDAENATTSGWTWTSGKSLEAISSADDTSTATAAISTAHQGLASGGSYYFMAMSWNDITQNLSLEKNSTYLLDLDYYALNGNASITASDENGTLATKPTTSVNSSWNHCAMVFKTTDSTNVTIKLHTGWANYAFDNLKVQKISAGNGVANGDAEIGATYGWTSSRTEATAFVVRNSTTDTSAASTAHASLANGGNYYFVSWTYNTLSQNVKLEPNTTYSINLDYYSSVYGITLTVTDGTITYMNGLSVVQEANKWKHRSLNFTTGDTTDLTVKLYTSGNNGGFYFDNFRINTVSVKNGVINGNAESGNTYGWSCSTANAVACNEAAASTADVAAAHKTLGKGGDYYFSVWGYQTATQTVTLEPNTEYFVSMRYYTDQYGGKLTLEDSTGALANMGTIQVATDLKNWRTVSSSFTTGTDSAVTVKVYGGNTSTTFSFDEFKIAKVKKENTLVNGDFEAGIDANVYGWNTTGAGYVTGDKYSYADIWWGKTLSQNLTLEPNTMYQISFDGYSTVSSTAVLVDSASNTIMQSTFTGTWNKYATNFVTGDETNITLTFKNVGGICDVTNISLKKSFASEDAKILTELKAYNNDTNDMREGIRYTNSLLLSADEKVLSLGTSYKVKEMGMLFATDAHLDGSDLTYDLLGDSQVQKDKVQNYISFETNIDSATSQCKFECGVDNIDITNKDRLITSRAYILCEDSEGNTLVIYDTPKTDSVKSIYDSLGSTAFSEEVNSWMTAQ